MPVQILLEVCQKLAMVRITENGSYENVSLFITKFVKFCHKTGWCYKM